jgi:gliding motility-associated-like protein
VVLIKYIVNSNFLILTNKYSKILLSFFAMLVANNLFAQMEFIENKGQWQDKVKYRGDFGTGSFFLEKNGFTVDLHNPIDLLAVSDFQHGITAVNNNNASLKNTIPLPQNEPTVTVRSHAYSVTFLGGNTSNIIPDKSIQTANNYFIGNDKTKWASNCKIYQAVLYQNVYPNIDVRYYVENNNLKYDFIIKPGGNPNAIALRYDGVNSLQVKNNELLIGTSITTSKELYPYTYQFVNGKKEVLDCKYVVRDNVVTFKVKNYLPTQTVIIDPVLIFSSFTGSTAENWGYTATPGPDGSFYAGGISFGSGYPVSVGPYQTTYGGGQNEDGFGGFDMAFFKFSANGSTRLFATYFGGGGNEQPHSMMCDAQGNLFFAGRSSSNNYPGAPRSGRSDYDIVVSKLSTNGATLLGSIRIGGTNDDGINIRRKYATPDGDDDTRRNYGDDARSEVIIDADGNIVVVSCTQSPDFPIVGGGVQPSFGGGVSGPGKLPQDGVILKFNSTLTTTLFSTFFGGNGNDACFVVAQDPITKNYYVGGATTSSNLLGDKTNVKYPIYQGGATDGFLTQINNTGTAIIKTSYFGTGGNDLVYGVQFDKKGFPYIMGTTTGSWPVVSATFSNPGSKQFISKLKPDLSDFVYSTVFGRADNSPNLSPIAFLVDRCENVYVSGWGGGINSGKGYTSSGTSNMPSVNPLPGIPAPDASDFYFFVLERNATSQLFGSHFGHNGGTTGDHVDGGTSRFDANGIIYQAVCACKDNGGPFYTTPGVWRRNNGATSCNQAVIKIDMNFAGIGANIKTLINNIPDAISGCSPLKLVVFDSLSKAKSFFWNWGDGSKIDTLHGRSDTSHIYQLPIGVNERYYTIMLIAEDSSQCNIRDTAFKTIKVSINFATLDLSFAKLDPCTNLTFQFTNKSTAVVGSFDQKGFAWDFGDGMKDTGSITYNPIHTYQSAGTYKVRLCVIDSFVCNSPDCRDTTINVASTVKAAFRFNSPVCVGRPVTFNNNSTGGQTFKWEFGDNKFSTDATLTVTHVYDLPGTYNVRLIAENPNTCNKIDTSQYQTITVVDKPKAFATWGVQPPQANTRTFFTNQSSGAIRYLWNFGDGESSTDVNPIHQYNETNDFNAELIAYNSTGCTDTFPLLVSAIINPLLDVPNAFTPGKFGENGIVKVVGFGISKISWKIYNRWGQAVFETNDRKQGWDGTFKGALQAADVYVYTLDVEFFDGKKLRKTGDINLLR